MPSPNNDHGAQAMWVAIGDIHDDLGHFSDIPELADCDGIIITGDLTLNGGAARAEKVMDAIKKTGKPVWAQIGNMDKADVDKWLSETGINLHRRVVVLNPGVAIFGVGGSTITPFGTPSEFEESAYELWLGEMWAKARQYEHAILVSHNPPKDSKCDDLGNGVHVGSVAVRRFLEKCQPDLCLCGHIHEAKACDRIGETLVINPGPINEGGYIVIRLSEGQLSAELRELGAYKA